MTFSVTLSVRDVHFQLIPTASSSSSAAPSASNSFMSSLIGPSSPIVSVKLQPKAEQQGSANNATAAAESGEDSFDIVADLSQFSGTLCISSAGGGIPQSAAIYPLPKEETSVVNPKEDTTALPSSPKEKNAMQQLTKMIDSFPAPKEDNFTRQSTKSIDSFHDSFLEATMNSSNKLLDIVSDDQVSEIIEVGEDTETREESVEEVEYNKGEMQDNSFFSVFDAYNDVNSKEIEDALGQFDDDSIDSKMQLRAISASMKGERTSTERRLALTQMQTERLFSNLSSELHVACSSHNTPMATLRSILEANPGLAAQRDAMGDMPIHVFARNEVLALSEEAEHAILFMNDLIKAAPQCIVTPSADDDRIPFVASIVHWVEEAYKNRDFTIAKDSLQSVKKVEQETGAAASLSFKNLSKDEQCLIFLFPLNLSVTPFVSWSLTMLSAALNTLHKMRTLHRRRKMSAYKLNETRNRIIQEVSSIPLFCKTILMLESNEELNNILGLTIMTNTCLHPNSIGPWLIAMFHGDRLAKMRVVEYLDLVSNMTVDNMIGGSRRWFQIDQDAFIDRRQETFSAFAKLPGIIPATRVLGRKRLERATATDIMHYALNDRIGQPLVLGALVFDGLFHFILLIAYRFIALEVSDSGDRFSDAAYMLVYIPAGYFIAREILTVSSIIISSKRLLLLYLRNPWSMLDLLSVVMTTWTASMVLTKGRDFDGALWIAVTIVLLWFKVLGYLRYVNRQLTTFISSFFEILGAIKWFFLVLLVAIMLFGDTVETILKFTPGSCADDLSDPSNRMLGAQEDFCSPHPWQSYIRIYSVVIGDVSLDDFQQTTLMTVLFVAFTFFGIIVLLNILIAIVNDSYSKAIMRSYGLFGRARVELVVRQLAREYFTNPYTNEHHGRRRPGRFEKALVTIRVMFSWIILAVVSSIIIVVELSLVVVSSRFLSVSGEGYGYFGAIFIVLTVLYSVALLVAVILFVCTSSHFNRFMKCSGSRTSRIIMKTLSRFVMPLRHALAVDNRMQSLKSDYDTLDDWTGQLRYLEVKTKQIVQISEEHLRNDVKAELRASEERQINKMKMLQNQMQESLMK